MRTKPAALSFKALILLAALGFGLAACFKAPSPADVRAMMEITDLTTKWVAKSYSPWPPQLTLVPTVSLRVKNMMAKPLKYIDINAVFAFKGDPQHLGEDFRIVIDSKAILPGEKTPVITFVSPYGLEGRNLEFIKSHAWWTSRVVEVKIFANTKGSGPILMGTWAVSQDIDFTEPKAPGPKTDNAVPPTKK